MQIDSSLDWPEVSAQLRKIGRNAANDPRLVRVLANIGKDVTKLSNMEVDARRNKRPPNLQYKELLSKINESITELEMLLMIAALGK